MSESSEFQVGDRVRVASHASHFENCVGTVLSIGGIRAYCLRLDRPALTAWFSDWELELVEPRRGAYVVEPDSENEEFVPFGSERASQIETRVVNEQTGGAKGSKPQRFSLLPWDVLSKLAEHYAKGAAKYDDHNWRKGYDWSLSIDALGRHLAAFIEGETYDPETGSHHMLAVMFHAASLVYFTDEFPELDDRRNTKGANDRAE